MSLSPQLLKMVDEKFPKINPKIGLGIVYYDCQNPMGKVNETLTSSINNAIPGLKYEGWHWLSPEQEYRERAQLVRSNKISQKGQDALRSKAPSTINIDPNDMRMVCIKMSYKGKPLPDRNLLIHYVSKYNNMTINGARYRFAPVLYDAFPSVSRNDVFIQLDKAKVTFRNNKNVLLLRDEELTRINVVCSALFNDKGSSKVKQNKMQVADVRMDTCLVHYMLCHYGINNLFEKVLKLKIDKDVFIYDEQKFTPQFDKNEYVVYKSIRKQPNTYLGHTNAWSPTYICIAVKKNRETPLIRNYIAGIYYILGNFSAYLNMESLNEPIKLMHTLGIILFGPTESLNMIVNKVDSHIRSLDSYMEASTAANIRAKGYNVKNIYELMAVVVENYDRWVAWYKQNSSSCYEKTISTRHYTYFQINRAVNLLVFALTGLYNRKGDNVREQDIVKELTQTLRPLMAYKVISEHGSELAVISDATDRPILNAGTHIVPQSHTAPGGKNRRTSVTPEVAADSSVSVACSYLAIAKSNPSGRSSISPWLDLGDDRVVRKPEKYADLLDRTQAYLKGTNVN